MRRRRSLRGRQALTVFALVLLRGFCFCYRYRYCLWIDDIAL